METMREKKWFANFEKLQKLNCPDGKALWIPRVSPGPSLGHHKNLAQVVCRSGYLFITGCVRNDLKMLKHL